jgi:hypothetical protein
MIGEQAVIQSVRVTNSNDFKIVDRFDGVPYEFEPGKGLAIPLDAAFHIFGWTHGATEEQVFQHTQRRFGWNTPSMVQGNIDRKFFSRLKIEPVVYRMVEVKPDDQPELTEQANTDSIAPPKKVYRNKAAEAIDERIDADRETARRLEEHIAKRQQST